MNFARYYCTRNEAGKSGRSSTDLRWVRRALGAFALGVLLITAGINVGQASPVLSTSIFLYTESGPLDVSATYSFYDYHVYDPDGHLVGTVNVYCQIVDAGSNVIGYVGTGPD